MVVDNPRQHGHLYQPEAEMITVAIADHFAPLMVFSRKPYQYAALLTKPLNTVRKTILYRTRRSIRGCTQGRTRRVFPFLQRVGFAAPAINLRPAGNAGFTLWRSM